MQLSTGRLQTWKLSFGQFLVTVSVGISEQLVHVDVFVVLRENTRVPLFGDTSQNRQITCSKEQKWAARCPFQRTSAINSEKLTSSLLSTSSSAGQRANRVMSVQGETSCYDNGTHQTCSGSCHQALVPIHQHPQKHQELAPNGQTMCDVCDKHVTCW